MLLKVYFEIKKEAVTFCDRLFHYDKQLEINWNTSKKFGVQIVIDASNRTSQVQEVIVKAMADVFIYHRETYWINHVVKRYYYFKNKEEIRKIVQLTQSIISGEDEDLGHILKDKKPRNKLTSIFNENEENGVIHFDSIVNFRMQPYQKELIEVVGLAIDEFKREEEYQTFVQSLREFIEKKKSKCSVIHVLQGTNFTFYNSSGVPIRDRELKAMIKKEPMYIFGLDEEEINLTPLIAMAPEQIRIYGNDPSEPKTHAIINIFQERVSFEPLEKFPFSDYQKTR